MEPTALTAQQTAIQDVRARYERGELSFEQFRRALDALVLARDAEDCQAILGELPAAPLALLSGLEHADPSATPSPLPRRRRHKWIIAFMGQTKKTRRPWQLAPSMRTVAWMGEVKLDLSRAQIPPHARLHVVAVMGAVTLYVPRGVHISVRSAVLLGDANALGESASGVIAFGHEEHVPAPGPAAPRLEVEAFVLMGNLKVVLTDRPVYSIGELARDVLQVATEGVRRGLRQASSQRASQSAGGDAAAETP